MNRISHETRFLKHVWRFNLASAMEYRASFLFQVITMLVNDVIYFVFWLLFFNRINQVHGWKLEDMLILFGIVNTGFGISFALFGNAARLAVMIEQGQLDYYLALPRDPLMYTLASRTSLSAVGDLLFGVCCFLLSRHLSLSSVLLWVVCSALVGSIIVSYSVITGSLAFWLGRARGISEQAIGALLTTSLYPTGIYGGSMRFVLYTLVPAGFVAAIPVQAVRDTNVWLLAKLAVFAAGIFIVSTLIFRRGLRRYESGNILNVNG